MAWFDTNSVARCAGWPLVASNGLYRISAGRQNWIPLLHHHVLDADALDERTLFMYVTAKSNIIYILPLTSSLVRFTVPPERAVINKERAAGTFRLSAYFIGKTLAESPIELILPFIFGTITYWMVGLSTDFYSYLLYLLLLFLFVLFGSSMGLFIGTVVVNMKQALSLSVVAILGSTLLGGFFVNKENLHVWIRWARWVSPIKYGTGYIFLLKFTLELLQTSSFLTLIGKLAGYEAMMLNEFKVASSETYTNSDPSNYDTNPITSKLCTFYLFSWGKCILWWDAEEKNCLFEYI